MKQRRRITKGVEELGLGEGLVGVVPWPPESDVGLKGKGAHPLDRCKSSKRRSTGTNLTFHNSVANTLCQGGHHLCVLAIVEGIHDFAPLLQHLKISERFFQVPKT